MYYFINKPQSHQPQTHSPSPLINLAENLAQRGGGGEFFLVGGGVVEEDEMTKRRRQEKTGLPRHCAPRNDKQRQDNAPLS